MDNNPTSSVHPSQENIKIEMIGFPCENYKVWANLVTFEVTKQIYH